MVDVVIFPKKNDPLSKQKRKNTAAKNFARSTHTKGVITKSGMKTIKEKGETYLLTTFLHREYCKQKGIKTDAYNTFITLTLPSKQIHSDEEIKKNCLSPFLSYLTRSKGCKAYIWRCELQQNGNIHFHLFTDRFIQWSWIREVWNNIVAPLGYIDEFERQHGHRDPNSTDVERVGKIDKAIKYLAKYLSKSTPAAPRQIEGRHYGMSDNIREFCTPLSLSNYDREELLSSFQETCIEFDKKFINDFASLFYNENTTLQNLWKADPLSMRYFINHYLTIAQNLGIK